MNEIKTLVYQDRATDTWVADISTTDNTGTSWITFAPTWVEAMQAAQAMRALLDRLLTDQMHAERMQRRYGSIYLTEGAAA